MNEELNEPGHIPQKEMIILLQEDVTKCLRRLKKIMDKLEIDE